MREFLIGRLAVCFVVLASSVLSAGPPQRDSLNLVDATVASTGSLQGLGSPFRFVARIETFDETGQSHQGVFSLIGAAADRWREELLVPGRESLRVAVGDKLWIRRTRDFEQPAVLVFREAVDPVRRVESIRGLTTSASLHLRRIGKIAAQCFSATNPPEVAEEFCADPSTGALIEARRGPWRVRYSDHVKHGGRFFPKSIRVFRSGRLRLDAWVVELDVDPATPSYLFEPPPGAASWRWCADRVPPRLISKSRLESDSKAVGRSELKLYSAYALISPEGQVERVRLLTPAAEELRPAIVEALRIYRFQPATCGQMAVPYEMALDTKFD